MEINLNGSGIGINNYSEVLIVDVETRNTFCEDNSYNQDTLTAYANQLAFKNITTVCKPVQTGTTRITQDKINKTSRSTFPRITDNALLGNCIDNEALACQNESLPLDIQFVIDLSTPTLRQVSDLATFLDQFATELKAAYGSGVRVNYTFLTPVDSSIDTSTTWTIQYLSGSSTASATSNTGIIYNKPVACATIATLNASYSNGKLGVGATLTAGGSRSIPRIDGYQPLIHDRILVKDQESTIANGVYVVTDVGSDTKPWVLTRASDFDGSAAEVTPGWATTVNNGLINKGVSFVETGLGTLTPSTHAISFGVDGIVFKNVVSVQYSCVTPSIVEYLNANNSKLLLSTSASTVCPYDIILNNLIQESSFTYGTIITDGSVIKARDIKKCHCVRRSLAYMQVFVISNRSFTLSADAVVEIGTTLNKAAGCGVVISPIVTNGQLTSDFSKAFNIFMAHGVDPYTVFNSSQLFSVIHGQVKKYYDGLFINIANNNDLQYVYQSGTAVNLVKSDNSVKLAVPFAVDFSAYDPISDTLALVIGHELQLIKLTEYRLIAKTTYLTTIVGVAFDKLQNIILLTTSGSILTVASTTAVDLFTLVTRYTVDISSYGSIPSGSVRYYSPKAVDVEFLTFAVYGDVGASARYAMALRIIDNSQVVEVLPYAASFIGYDYFTQRFYVLDAVSRDILRFDGVNEYYFNGLSNPAKVYDLAVNEAWLDDNSGQLVGVSGTTWKSIDVDGVSTTLAITQNAEVLLGIKNNIACPDDYALLSLHNVPFGGISNWSNRNKDYDSILVSSGGSTYRQYLDLKAGSTYTLTLNPVIYDQVNSLGNLCVSIGFTGVSYQYQIHRTGPVTILFGALGGPCVIEFFVSPFYASKEIAIDNVILCETKEISCGLIENVQMTLKWGTTESIDIPRIPLNVFNAFVKLKYRNPLVPSQFTYAYLIPTCEGHTCIGDPPKEISSTCNYGDTVDFWKQQGLGSVAQLSILAQNLTTKVVESVTANKAVNIDGLANWLWSVPQSKSAFYNDELTAYFPSYEDAVNVLDTIEVYVLANQVYPDGDFPPKNCDGYPLSFEDPGMNLSLIISYDDQKKVNHSFSKVFSRNDIYTTYGDFTKNLPSQWDTLTSLGNGVRGRKAAWYKAAYVLDTPDGKQPDGSPTLNQCSKPLKVILNGVGSCYMLPGPAQDAPEVSINGNGYNRRPCNPQMRFDMVNQGRSNYSIISLNQPKATGGTYTVTFEKSNNGVVGQSYVFQLSNGETPEVLAQLLSSRDGFVTAASDIGISGNGTSDDPFILAFIGRSQGLGYSITKTDGSKLAGAGSYTTEIVATGGAEKDVYTVRYKTNAEVMSSRVPNAPFFDSYYAKLYLTYGNTTYSPPANAGATNGGVGVTSTDLLNYINALIDPDGKTFGATFGKDFVSVSPGADANFGPFTIGFPMPKNGEKAQIYYKTILRNNLNFGFGDVNQYNIDSRDKLPYDPIILVQKSTYGVLTSAKQVVNIVANSGTFKLGLPSTSGTKTPRGLYVVVSYEYPNANNLTSSAPFNILVSGLDKDSTGNHIQYEVAATPDRCSTLSPTCDAFIAYDANISLNIQYLKSTLRGVNGSCANNVYSSFTDSTDTAMSDWVSKIVDSFDLILTTVTPFAPNVNLSDQPPPSSLPACDIHCLVRVYVDNGTNDTNTMTEVFSQVVKAAAGIEYTKTYKVSVPKSGYVYTGDIQYNAPASDVLAAVRAVQSTIPSDAVVQLSSIDKAGSKANYTFKWNAGYTIDSLAVDTTNLTGGVITYANIALGSYEKCVQRLTLQTVSDGYFSVNVAYGGRSATTDAINIPFRDVDLQYALLNTKGTYPVDCLTVSQVQTDDPYYSKLYDVTFAPFMGAVPLMQTVSDGTIRCYPVIMQPVPLPPYTLPIYDCVEGPEDLLFAFCGMTGDGPEAVAATGLSAKQLASTSNVIKTRAELINPDQRLTLRQMILRTRSGSPNEFVGYMYDSIGQIIVRIGLDTVMQTQTSYMIVNKRVYNTSYNFQYSSGVYEDNMIDRMSTNLYNRVRTQSNLLPGRIQPQIYAPKASTFLIAPTSSLKCST